MNQLKKSIASNNVRFSRFNAKLSDNRMNERHWRLPSWRHSRLLAVTYYITLLSWLGTICVSSLAAIMRVNI